MLLLPGFNACAAFTFLDPLRAANYIHGQKHYDWAFLSLGNQPVTASNELVISNVNAFDTADHYDLVVINASWAPERFQQGTLQTWLKQLSHQKTTLAGIDTGAFVLAYTGLLKHHRATVHYEHAAAFIELFPETQLEEALYVSDRNRLTCGGGLAAADMALRIVQKQQGLEMANAAATYILKGRHRAGNEQQIPHNLTPVAYAMPEALREAIILMERNIEEPLSPSEIAQYLSISQRTLQRVFKQHTGQTPIRYYINLRLDRARGLITQTNMSVAEVAIACGFGSVEPFSRAYSKHFNIAPSQDRIDGRVPFQLRT